MRFLIFNAHCSDLISYIGLSSFPGLTSCKWTFTAAAATVANRCEKAFAFVIWDGSSTEKVFKKHILVVFLGDSDPMTRDAAWKAFNYSSFKYVGALCNTNTWISEIAPVHRREFPVATGSCASSVAATLIPGEEIVSVEEQAYTTGSLWSIKGWIKHEMRLQMFHDPACCSLSLQIKPSCYPASLGLWILSSTKGQNMITDTQAPHSSVWMIHCKANVACASTLRWTDDKRRGWMKDTKNRSQFKNIHMQGCHNSKCTNVKKKKVHK